MLLSVVYIIVHRYVNPCTAFGDSLTAAKAESILFRHIPHFLVLSYSNYLPITILILLLQYYVG